MATPPTFVSENETAWNTNTTPKTVSSTAASGDVFVVAGAAEQGDAAIATPTGGTSITWTQNQTQGTTTTTAHCKLFTASPSAQSWTLSVARGATARFFGFNALRFSGSNGIGASSSTNNTTGSGAPSLGITTTQDNSAVVVVVADWNASDGTTRTWRDIGSGAIPSAANGFEVTYFRDSSTYSVFIAYYPDAGTAGAKTVGILTPSAQRYVIAAAEVLGTTSGGVTLPPELIMAPIRRY